MGLDAHGIAPTGTVWWNLPAAALYEHAIAAGDGEIAEGGPLVVSTGAHTGRRPEGQVRRPRARQRGPHLVGRRSTSRSRPRTTSSLGERLRAHLAGAPTST